MLFIHVHVYAFGLPMDCVTIIVEVQVFVYQLIVCPWGNSSYAARREGFHVY